MYVPELTQRTSVFFLARKGNFIHNTIVNMQSNMEPCFFPIYYCERVKMWERRSGVALDVVLMAFWVDHNISGDNSN